MKNKLIVILGSIVLVVAIIITTIIIVDRNKKEENLELKKEDNLELNKEDNLELNIEIANMINDNSNLPIQYMSQYESKDPNLQKYEFIDNFMSKDFYNEDISFSYYGYPNDESEIRLGRISLLTKEYNILGVTIGDNLKETIPKLEKYGFQREESDNDFSVTLIYDDFAINLEANIDETTIKTMKLEAKSEYLGNNLY